ncbi:MAG: hypothetical protein M1834_003361 [Cirrosporium novae-zelandiae]|nr:MAG: hypothetical protein M1834_003361 [Cirrosporium novae-zelandiae]
MTRLMKVELVELNGNKVIDKKVASTTPVFGTQANHATGVVFTFTSLLFLSGYVLQQQTVHNIQAVIKIPTETSASSPSSPTIAAAPAIGKTFGSPPGSKGHVAYKDYVAQNHPAGGWNKVAYVQLVRKHLHVCNALMVFAELEKQKSPAARALLYPKSWDDDAKLYHSGQTDTTIRLLKKAAQKFGVRLVPIEPMGRLSADDLSEIYPVAGLFSLTAYDRIIYLEPSGLLLGPRRLDGLLTTSSQSSILSLSGPTTNDVSPLLLMKPNHETFKDILKKLNNGYTNGQILSGLESRAVNETTLEGNLVIDTADLKSKVKNIDLENFWDSTSYVHVSDHKLPGPEYSIPRELYWQQRPQMAPAGLIWDDIYERYRQLRMDVCGLDLEPVSPAYAGRFRTSGEEGGELKI